MAKFQRILVTGGAGFIGSHTVDLLVDKGYDVTIVDNLDPQVHGAKRKPPAYLNRKPKLVRTSVSDRTIMKSLLRNSDAVIHLAARVGLSQSMYRIRKYVDANTLGTAALLDMLVNSEHNVKKLVVASSMAVYGEGAYFCNYCNTDVYPKLRTERMKNNSFEQVCPRCSSDLVAKPTSEDKPLSPESVYSLTKRHQEEMCLMIGRTYGLPTVALRYFNTYGSRQALSNPYTGAAAIFISRVLANKPPCIFEDAAQTRDFLHVRDIARANVLALEKSSAKYTAINVASGKVHTVKEFVETILRTFNSNLKPMILNQYRKGDIRHCVADITKARELLGFSPSISLQDGIAELVKWSVTQPIPRASRFEKLLEYMRKEKLVV